LEPHSRLGDEHCARYFWRELRECALEVVATNLPAIERVAQALSASGKLGADSVRTVAGVVKPPPPRPMLHGTLRSVSLSIGGLLRR